MLRTEHLLRMNTPCLVPRQSRTDTRRAMNNSSVPSNRMSSSPLKYVRHLDPTYRHVLCANKQPVVVCFLSYIFLIFLKEKMLYFATIDKFNGRFTKNEIDEFVRFKAAHKLGIVEPFRIVLVGAQHSGTLLRNIRS